MGVKEKELKGWRQIGGKGDGEEGTEKGEGKSEDGERRWRRNKKRMGRGERGDKEIGKNKENRRRRFRVGVEGDGEEIKRRLCPAEHILGT